VFAYAHIGGAALPMPWRYAAAFMFSLVGGLVPSSLFSLASRLAPNERALASTVGWMQQWSALGQFSGPPLVGWVAGLTQGWQYTWMATGALSVVGLVIAALIARHPGVRVGVS
jgi:MFS family permease